MSSLLKDIALKAGVTTGTVSRALSNKPGVSEKKRREILALAEDMNYVPNFQASSLRTGKRKGLTIITSQFGYNSIGALRNYVLLKKAIDEFACANIQIKGSAASLHHAVQNALAEKCRFLVMSGISESSLEEKTVKLIKNSQTVVVFMDCQSELFDSVRIYRENGMYQAVRLLLMSGCEKILFYNSSTFENPNDRLRGAMAAYESMGLPLSSINLWPFDEKMSVLKHGFSVGYEVTVEVLNSKPVDGLFCSNDELAIGALCAIREKGLRVPEDIKVVGFDNIPESRYTAPPMTTVGQPIEKMTDAVIGLCKRKEENRDAEPESLEFQTNLIARESAPLPDPKLRGEIFMELD